MERVSPLFILNFPSFYVKNNFVPHSKHAVE